MLGRVNVDPDGVVLQLFIPSDWHGPVVIAISPKLYQATHPVALLLQGGPEQVA
jgi:hypothetical protein